MKAPIGGLNINANQVLVVNWGTPSESRRECATIIFGKWDQVKTLENKNSAGWINIQSYPAE
jgi:hypothetical protein